MPKRIGRLFALGFGHPDGCHECKCTLYEGTSVAWVDDKLTCKDCIDKYRSQNRTRRKAEQRKRGT